MERKSQADSLSFSFQGLMHSSGPVGRHRQLILVLEGELYLIPFALLKGSSSNEYLYERFSLIAVPSIQSLNPSSKVWYCLIKPLSHRTSPVGCRFLYMLEYQQLCPAVPSERTEIAKALRCSWLQRAQSTTAVK